MKRKDLIYSLFKKQSRVSYSAAEISELLQLDRANVSSDLNKLVKEELLSKSSSRPVVFFLNADRDLAADKSEVSLLDSFQKENRSLRTAIDQAKSAILYPPHGMHTLIFGETGVGKSMFASIMHQFALEAGRLHETAPFVVFNCADYANNPQLLLGQLFGVKKGAYTGAVEQKGLIEKADGGILFLDEVHRLTPEGQEMLFTFIDGGMYRRLGESENERTAQVLILAATTEDPVSSLLGTFKRRMPMFITLPPLRERSSEERLLLIKRFFTDESIRLGKEISVSTNTIRALLFYPCSSNIGQLKADIQLTCAKAYADYVTNKKQSIHIRSSDLNWYIKEGLFIEKKTKHTLIQMNEQYTFSPTESYSVQSQPSFDHSIYEHIDLKYEELKNRDIDQSELAMLMDHNIQSLFKQYLKQTIQQMSKDNLQKILSAEIVKVSEKIIHLAEKRLNRTFDEKVFVGLSLHLQTLMQRLESHKSIYHPNLTAIREQYRDQFNVAIESMRLVEDTFSITIPFDEVAFLTMFFVVDSDETPSFQTAVFVLAHGNGIAREMAAVTNHLLGNEDVTGIDMPLHESPEEFLQRVKREMQPLNHCTGLLLLIDMGSLAFIGEMIETEFSIPVKVIPMVSTAHVIEASRKASLGYHLDELYEDVKNLTPFYMQTQKEKQSNSKTLKSVILTACLTGEGSAIALKNILENYLHFNSEIIEILPISIFNRKEMQKMLTNISKERSILCVVCNFEIALPYRTIHVQDILNMKEIKTIQELITHEETYIKMADALQQTLTIDDAGEVITIVRNVLNDLQLQTNTYLNHESLMGIVLHISCMLDRLRKNQPFVKYPDKDAKINEHYLLYLKIRKALNKIEEAYQIVIPNDEVCFIMDFLLKNESSAKTNKTSV
ncbi:sigma 54-interacting transcriptional regulator [Bacillus sp. CMF21]|nr:sigma 54-interacting transcriptional regulator [Bacillus sp. CMF21]